MYTFRFSRTHALFGRFHWVAARATSLLFKRAKGSLMAKVLIFTGLLLGLSTTLSLAGVFSATEQGPAVECIYTAHGDVAGCATP